MTKPLSPIRTLPVGRPRHRGPAGRTTVVPLVGDLDTCPRELKADLVALLRRDTTLVLDLRGATFLGAGAARLLLDLRARAAASGVRLALWRPAGQPLRTLRIARFERVFDLRPASWRPSPPRPDLPPTETRPDSRRGGWASGRDRPSALSGAASRFVA